MTNRESERMKAAAEYVKSKFSYIGMNADLVRTGSWNCDHINAKDDFLAGGEYEYAAGFEACKQKMLEQVRLAVASGCDVSIRTDWFSKTIEQLTPTGPGEGEG